MGRRTSPRLTRVLLCDDTKDILALLAAEFDLHEDLEIVGQARDGAEAVDLARDLQPDVIVLDLVMPRMDGLQALPRLRAVAPESTVIVLSAFEEEVMARRAVDLGATLYIEKGTPASEVADAVRANSAVA
ncbi:MAG: response regulator transcription factor [Actinomycetota bacterium]|nr:response regulator transcription factor [Actinomycetota bacterium]